MVFGGIAKERIALTESTIWSDTPGVADVNPGGVTHLRQIRQLLFEGDYVQARTLCEKHLLSHATAFGTNLPPLDAGPTRGMARRRVGGLCLDDLYAHGELVGIHI
jgi:alpha-L-fucosidase 2